MPGLVLKPWKRYGKDRTYVVTDGGTTVGFVDNLTGEVHVEDEAMRSAVLRACGRAPSEQTPAIPYAVTIDRWARDVAQNQAGAGAQAKAREHRDQAPVRTLLARVLGQHTDERAWRVGAEGERVVGGELDQLRHRGWAVLHDVDVGDRGANIDHVVLGPGGVFTVNSKYHWTGRVWAAGDTVKVNGRHEPYVKKARFEAQRAGRLLGTAVARPVRVTGLVVIVCQDRTVQSQPAGGDVLVLGPREARLHLERLPAVLSPPDVEALVRKARRSTTWQP